MKMKKMIIMLNFILLVSGFSYAQVGRHELPLDTTEIGGKQQEKKMEQKQGKDQLTKDLIALRDSVNNKITILSKNSDRYSTNVANAVKDRYKKAMQELTLAKDKLDKAINEALNTKNWNADMNRRTDQLLTATREEFNRIRQDFEDE